MRFALSLVVVCAACGGGNGDDGPPADGPPAGGDIAAQLAALPGVTVTEKQSANIPQGDRYFVLQITQPVDHAAAGGATFQQEVSLIHHDVTAPMVLFTTGYDDYNHDYPSEPMLLVSGNQISVEYRFFGTSRPSAPDWSKLTIKQMADDEHAIVELLKPIYGGKWISTGGSKGGMTASYHHRFYPDDIAGTVAYVAPMSFSIPDQRYAAVLAADGTEPCADNVRAVALELLKNRRAAMLSHAMSEAASLGYQYTRVPIGPSVESAILDLEWSYWQYAGVGACGGIPAAAAVGSASDDALYAILEKYSGVSFTDDDEDAEFEAYFYQAYAQLGSPGTTSNRGDLTDPALQQFRMYTDADYTGTLPAGVPLPAFDASAMQDIKTWIATEGSHFVFEYGQYDPWSGGRYDIGSATDTIELTSPQGTHDDGLYALSAADQAAAYAKISAWTGVTVTSDIAGDIQPALRAVPRKHRHGLQR